MKFDIEFSDEALFDLQEARDYYFEVSPSLLFRFDEALVTEIERLELNPENFQKRYRHIKIVYTKKFPYSIHYFIEENTVFIQRILHQKQYYK